jgi:type IV pilus assembly protein PilX
MKSLSLLTLSSSTKRPRSTPRRQAGIAIVVALLALVAVTMATLALVRSVGTGLEIAGNMAFKESTTTAADVATNVVTDWLVNNSMTLTASQSSGYYANWMSGCDITGNRTPSDNSDDVGWTGSAGINCKDLVHGGSTGVPMAVSGMPTGYTASYFVTRMCFCEGPASGYCPATTVNNSCVGVPPAGRYHETPTYDNRGLNGQETGRISASVSPYYRIVVRVTGPRNTVSFVETMVTLDY